jgi:hypothetical protein
MRNRLRSNGGKKKKKKKKAQEVIKQAAHPNEEPTVNYWEKRLDAEQDLSSIEIALIA